MAKPVILAAVHPNEGLTAAYQKKLDTLIEEMNRSLVYWISAAYRAKPPELASDAYTGSSANVLRDVMRRFGRKWLKRFNDAAPELARYYATAFADRSDKALAAILRKGGISVKFQMTKGMNDAIQASIGGQVSLIKSIASEHLTAVEGLVMRSVQAGRELGTLTAELEKRFGVTKRRAALIARHQNNMATATMQRCRQMELGIKEAIWLHSHGGKEPRPSHVKAGADKLVYSVEKGALIDGEYIFPGVLINCRCSSRPVLPKVVADQPELQPKGTKAATQLV